MTALGEALARPERAAYTLEAASRRWGMVPGLLSARIMEGRVPASMVRAVGGETLVYGLFVERARPGPLARFETPEAQRAVELSEAQVGSGHWAHEAWAD